MRAFAVGVAGLAVLVGCTPAEEAAPPAAPGFGEGTEDALQRALETTASSIDAPGAVGLVSAEDGRVWIGATGFASVGAGTSTRPDDLFRIGSITKTWVAAGVLQLVEEGVVALDDPAEEHLPDVWAALPEPPASPITIERLLSHRTGIVSYTDTPEFVTRFGQEHTPREVIDLCLDDGLDFEPGTEFAYSNTNYFVLARVVEAVEGRPWHETVRARLLEPRGLARVWTEGHEPSPPTVSGYLEGVDVTDRLDMSWSWASGGMVSDAADLAAWLRALLYDDVLEEASRAAMRTRVPLPDGRLPRYGLGLYVLDDGTRLGHTGSTMGFQSDAFATADGTVVVALVNDFLAEASDVAAALREVPLP